MTDNEYNDFFNRKKKETIDKLIGADVNYPVSDDAHTSPSKKKTPNEVVNYRRYSRELAMKWLGQYNVNMHVNNGKHVTYVDTGLENEVPPPVK